MYENPAIVLNNSLHRFILVFFCLLNVSEKYAYCSQKRKPKKQCQ